LMSAPMLIQQSVKSSNVALQQEAISAVASQVSIIQSMHWDENNSNIPQGESPILDVNRTAFIFPPVGLSSGVLGRNTKDSNITLSPSTIGIDINETVYTDFDDVDDYNGSSFGLILFNNESTTADIGEYVDTNITISTTVDYTKENNVSQSITNGSFSNIKFITVNLTNNRKDIPELEKNITMKAFSCNIGTYAVIGRKLPE